jgi:hypothetical protein
MINQQHTIKKFSLELQTQSAEQSYILQRKYVKLIKEDLTAGIDELLLTQFNDEDIIRINTIEIDLGNISSNDLEKYFTEKCIAAFTEKISGINTQRKPAAILQQAEKISQQENSIEQFLYFLLTGKMHWAIAGINFVNWQASLISAIKNKKEFFLEKLDKTVKQQYIAIERLVMQFDDTFITDLIAVYNPFIKVGMEDLLQLIPKTVPLAQMHIVRKKILLAILPLILKMYGIKEENKIAQLLPNLIGGLEDDIDKKVIMSLKDKIIDVIKIIDANTVIAELENTAVEKKTIGTPVATIKTEDETTATDNTVADKTVFIDNAGLVILHPFLQNFFKATGIMEAATFKNDLCKQKAAHLLQYLAGGQQQLPEYIMPLNKILCGLSNQEHIDRFMPVEKAALKEADELLQAVITHWVVLKNTSTEGLQQTFLQRKGKLSFNETDGYWKLQIERKAVDILLDKIPWGFAYVQLPWMKYPLVTEW